MSVQITDTTLRDAHQSLAATRMRTRDMLPVVEKLDQAGFFSLEVWGGATFDAAIRFLNEDPWERLREIRLRVKNTRLQMLLRGQNLVGYRHYADDVVREFIRLAVKNGVDVFRVFDALNDIRNMKLAIEVAKDYGAHVQGAICYTTSPVHTIEGFATMAQELEALGCDSICIKDMAGLISPAAASSLVAAIKGRVCVPVDLHSHSTSGMAPFSYYAAAISGVDIVDTAFAAFSGGTSQPSTEAVVAAFRDTPYDTGLDLGLLDEISGYFDSIYEKYKPLIPEEILRPSVKVLLHQIPGGMLSNLVSQLKEQNALDRLKEVLEEVPRVRADLGYPPLVTPTSQVVGIQAVMNVLSGGRYKTVTKEVREYLLGYYGRPPGPVNETLRRQIVGDEKPIEVRPADLLPPELTLLKSEAEALGIVRKEEDVITYALYPKVAVKFLRGELKEEAIPVAAANPVPSPKAPETPVTLSVDVDGEVFIVKVSAVSGDEMLVSPREEAKPTKPEAKESGGILAPMAGMILEIRVRVGDHISVGQTVATLEAMKMQNDIQATCAGTVEKVLAYEGEVVNTGDLIMVVSPDGA